MLRRPLSQTPWISATVSQLNKLAIFIFAFNVHVRIVHILTLDLKADIVPVIQKFGDPSFVT
jgi:hypothetical protein